jgi:hypothetical protein
VDIAAPAIAGAIVKGQAQSLQHVKQTYQDLHLVQHIVRSDQVVCDSHAVRLHNVPMAICI